MQVLLVETALLLLSLPLTTKCAVWGDFLASGFQPWDPSRRYSLFICHVKDNQSSSVTWQGEDNISYPGIRSNDPIGYNTFGEVGNRTYTAFRAPPNSISDIISVLKVTGPSTETQVVYCISNSGNMKKIENSTLQYPTNDTNEDITIMLVYNGSPFTFSELSYEVWMFRCIVRGMTSSVTWKVNGALLANYTAASFLHRGSEVSEEGMLAISILEHSSSEELGAALYLAIGNGSIQNLNVSCHSNHHELNISSFISSNSPTKEPITTSEVPHGTHSATGHNGNFTSRSTLCKSYRLKK